MASTDVARAEQPSSALVTREYLHEKAALVRKLYAPDATDLEFEHFIEVAATRGLNPLAKQLYCISRKNTKTGKLEATIQTGIDGFRLIAQRTGEYRGQVGPFWCGPDGIWTDIWLDEKAHPAASKVGVLREGFSEPVWGVCTWAAYADERSHFWTKTRGVNQLAKCAESLALRKAFPEELSGLYTTEEMQQAGPVVANVADPSSGASRFKALRKSGLTDPQIVERLQGIGVSASSELADDDVWEKAQEAVSREAEEPVEGEVIEGQTEMVPEGRKDDPA